jgi:hypothetical protein
MSLRDALALGPDSWNRVASPFMSWAWHRAWAESAPAAELDACAEFVSPHAVLTLRLGRVRFRRAWVRALTWAIGDTGCPDELDVPASADTDWDALAAAVAALPWVLPGARVETAPNADRLRAALRARPDYDTLPRGLEADLPPRGMTIRDVERQSPATPATQAGAIRDH